MKKLSVLITSPSIEVSMNVGGISSLTRLVIENNPQVNFSHFVVGKHDGQKRDAAWLFSQLSFLFRFLALVRRKDISIAHINFPMSSLSIFKGLALIVIAKLSGKPTIVHLRGGALSLTSDISKYQQLIIRKSLSLSDRVIVLGERERSFVIDNYVTDYIKICVMPNAVAVPNSDVVNESRAGRTDRDLGLRMLFIGRIDKNKGLVEILEAFKLIGDSFNFTFSVAGTGPAESWFLKQCTEVLGQKFVYLGVLDCLEKSEAYIAADVFLLPSHFEGLPNALLEAMAYGVVPLVTPVGSIAEVVSDGVDGFLVPLRDAQVLAQRMLFLHENRRVLSAMSEASHRRISGAFSIDEYVKRLNELYFSLAERTLCGRSLEY